MPEAIRRYATDPHGGQPPRLESAHDALLPDLIEATKMPATSRSAIAEQLARVSAHKPMKSSLSERQQQAVMLDYVEALSEFPAHAVAAAVRWAIRESTFWPTLAELLEQCRAADRPRLIAKQRLERLKWEADRKPKPAPSKPISSAQQAEMNRILAEMGSAVRVGSAQQENRA